MKLEKIPNHQLKNYLAGVGAVGVLSRYVCQKKALESSFAVLNGAEIVGVAISGLPLGLPEAYSWWVFGENGQVVQLLAEALETEPTFINFPVEYLDIFRAAYPEGEFSWDRLYVLNASQFKDVGTLEPEFRIERLFTPNLQKLKFGREIKSALGPLEDWDETAQLYGVVENGVELVAIAEMMVQDEAGNATIQQVYTVEKRRSRGLGRKLVGSISRILLEQGKIPSYLVSETNPASIKLVESLGFEMASRWGYLE